MTQSGQKMPAYIGLFVAIFPRLASSDKDAAALEPNKTSMTFAYIDLGCFSKSSIAKPLPKNVSELNWNYILTTLLDKYSTEKISYESSSFKYEEGNENVLEASSSRTLYSMLA